MSTLTKLRILARHSVLSAAVKDAKIDLSYNEELALADLKRAAKDPNYGEVFTVELNGKTVIFYTYTAPDGLKLLNRYSPFHGCLNDSPFRSVEVSVDGTELWVLPALLNRKARKEIASIGWTVTTDFS